MAYKPVKDPEHFCEVEFREYIDLKGGQYFITGRSY